MLANTHGAHTRKRVRREGRRPETPPILLEAGKRAIGSRLRGSFVRRRTSPTTTKVFCPDRPQEAGRWRRTSRFRPNPFWQGRSRPVAWPGLETPACVRTPLDSFVSAEELSQAGIAVLESGGFHPLGFPAARSFPRHQSSSSCNWLWRCRNRH